MMDVVECLSTAVECSMINPYEQVADHMVWRPAKMCRMRYIDMGLTYHAFSA